MYIYIYIRYNKLYKCMFIYMKGRDFNKCKEGLKFEMIDHILLDTDS